MRFIVKNDNDKTDKLKSDETYKALLEIAKNKDKAAISDGIYRDSYDSPDEKRSKVEDQLALSYKNKCAYCERICKADIEHYRPKSSVHDEKHDGYYWLCYEWTNLLPSCVKCNRDGAKLTKFTIKGKRIKAPTFFKGKKDLDLDANKAKNRPLIDEIPDLLHPEIDIPEVYFDFEVAPKLEGIILKGKDKGARGEETIKICKLNRQELRIDRKENVIDGFVQALDCQLLNCKKDKNGNIDYKELSDKILEQVNVLIHFSTLENKSHTLLRKYIVANRNNFEKIVIPFVDVKIQKIAMSAFKSIIKI